MITLASVYKGEYFRYIDVKRQTGGSERRWTYEIKENTCNLYFAGRLPSDYLADVPGVKIKRRKTEVKRSKRWLGGERNRRTVGRRGNLSRQLLNEEKKLEVYTQTGGEEPQVYSYTQQAEDDWEKQKKFGSKSGSM